MIARCGGGGGTVVTKVTYCCSPRLVTAFEAKRRAYEAQFGDEGALVTWGFHGAPSMAAIQAIVRDNFALSKVGSTTDAGYYGAGMYFSRRAQWRRTPSLSSPPLCEVSYWRRIALWSAPLGASGSAPGWAAV